MAGHSRVEHRGREQAKGADLLCFCPRAGHLLCLQLPSKGKEGSSCTSGGREFHIRGVTSEKAPTHVPGKQGQHMGQVLPGRSSWASNPLWHMVSCCNCFGFLLLLKGQAQPCAIFSFQIQMHQHSLVHIQKEENCVSLWGHLQPPSRIVSICV